MAAVTHLGATALTTNLSAYTSGSFSPVVGDLLIVYCAVSDSVAAAPTLTESAGGGTYILIGRATWRTSLDSLYVYVRNTLAEANTARTWTFTTADAATGIVFAIAKATSMTRAGWSAVRQFDTTDNGAGGVAPNTVFPAVALTANACIFGLGNGANPCNQLPPTSFTERVDTGYATPTTGFEYASRDSGHTSATIASGDTSATAWGAFALELNTLAPEVPELLMAPMEPALEPEDYR